MHIYNVNQYVSSPMLYNMCVFSVDTLPFS